MTFFCTCTHVRFYTLGTHHMGYGGVGMMTFLCTSTHVRFYTLGTHDHMGWGGVGWGGDKFLHIERKITSVVHSHPPSHYIRKHAPG